ncbi:hypothetical protein L7F22_015115 [Adiantum nelumboides]|nr:hypothetical protein [Adiantum nelumboides]
MEPHGKCCLAEEEISLTPHHTPSQSFDFIVWDKAHLNSISADSTSSSSSSTISAASSAIASTHKGNTQSYNRESGPQFVSDKSNSNHSQSLCNCPIKSNHVALLACKTDADLPSCFLDHKLLLSDGESAEPSNHCSCDQCIWRKFERLTSLEEAVCRSYAAGRTKWQKRNMLFSTEDYSIDSPQHRHRLTHNKSHTDYQGQMTDMHGLGNSEPQDNVEEDSSSTSMSQALYLKRSMSQPGVQRSYEQHGASKTAYTPEFHRINMCLLRPGACKHTASHPTIDDKHYHNDRDMPLQDHAKISCFSAGKSSGRHRQYIDMPSSPGPPIRIDSRKGTVREAGNGLDHSEYITDNFITLDVNLYHTKLPGSHELKSPKPIFMRTQTLPPPGHSFAAPLHAHLVGFKPSHADWSRSFSESSSPCAECHVQNAVMSKLNLGSLINHKLRGLWRKFCSSCPFV